MAVRFSVIVVSLNAGDKLRDTLDSVLAQSYDHYEIIVKDGGSRDGSLEALPRDSRIRLYQGKDAGIYDAMNQALAHAEGDLALFLNCGDVLYDREVLAKAAEAAGAESAGVRRMVLYGDTYGAKNGVRIAAPPHINGFVCYRNIPCHQSCFYGMELLREKPFDLRYRIRADYDQFLWCYYQGGARFLYLQEMVSSYEGGGFSESAANRKRDRQEHKEITEKYMGRGELFRYRAAMAATLAPIRRKIAENRFLAGGYQWTKEMLYSRRYWFLAAFFVFMLEVALLIWPVGWLKGDQVNALTGEGSWRLEGNHESFHVCQKFTPQYEELDSLGIVITREEDEVLGGVARL